MFPIDQILHLECSFMNVQKWKYQGWQREQSLKQELKGGLHTCFNYHWDSGNIFLVLKFLDEFCVGWIKISFFFSLIIDKRSTLDNCLMNFGEGRQRNFEETVRVELEKFYKHQTSINLIILLFSIRKKHLQALNTNWR